MFMLCMIVKFEINKLICILFVHLSSINSENFKDLVLIIPEIFEFLELHTYMFGLVYVEVITPEMLSDWNIITIHLISGHL